MVATLIHGTLIHSLTRTRLGISPSAILAVSKAGKVDFIREDVNDDAAAVIRKEYPDAEFLKLKSRQFILPGFVDSHTHAPQFTFAGTGQDLDLLKWLEKYTFPHEAAFSSVQYARRMYRPVVSRLINNGTTSACYFGTIHLDGTTALVDAVIESGQRAFVGKVCMDRNSPDFYVENTERSLADTREFIERVRVRSGGDDGLVKAILTPRFVPSCTMELQKGLAALAKEYDLPVQSHVSENRNEIGWVRELHPECSSYAEVYDVAGLLSKRTIMAHGIHLSETERRLFKERGVGVSHCPNSNFTLRSGVLNVRRLMDEGLKVGLGTDVSGGYHPSMLDAIRSAATASRVVHMSETRPQPSADRTSDPSAAADSSSSEYDSLSLPELLYLATLGGAELMNLPVGNFEVGRDFDALLVDPRGPRRTHRYVYNR